MNRSITRRVLAGRGQRLVGVRNTVVQRWPALLGAALVTVAVPAVAFASGTAFFTSDNLAPAIVASSFGLGIEAHGYSGGTGILVTGHPALNASADVYVSGSEAIQADSQDGTTIDAFGSKTVIDARSSQGRAIRADGPQGAVEAKSGNTSGLTNGAGAGVAVSATGEKVGVFSAGNDVGVRAQGKTNGVVAEGATAVRATGNTTANSFGAGIVAVGDEAVVARGTSLGVDASATDTAVAGIASQGVGGLFGGKEAPIRMFKAQTAGAPTSGLHHAGEFYVDSTGLLFYCTTDGTPGTWKQVVLK